MTSEAERVYPPMHPGRVLELEFLEPLEITPYRLAKDIGVDAPPRVQRCARPEVDKCRFGFEVRPVLRNLCRVLAQPPEPLRPRGRAR